MNKIKFKTYLGEETVLLEDVIKQTSNNTFLFEAVSKDDMDTIKNKIVGDSKLEAKVKEILKKELKGTELEKKITEIAKNCIIQLFKQLWLKRNSWSTGIVNKPN